MRAELQAERAAGGGAAARGPSRDAEGGEAGTGPSLAGCAPPLQRAGPSMQAQCRPTVCRKSALSCSLRSQLQHSQCRACVTPQRQGAGVNQLGADLAGYPVCDS